jgi:hypothetical protein
MQRAEASNAVFSAVELVALIKGFFLVPVCLSE